MFRFQFAPAVGRIGLRLVVLPDQPVILLMNRPKHAQGADVNEFLRYHIQCLQRLDKVFRTDMINPLEVFRTPAFGNTGAMNDIIPASMRFLMCGELSGQCVEMNEIQFDESDALILQVLPSAGLSYSRPRQHSPRLKSTDNKPAVTAMAEQIIFIF